MDAFDRLGLERRLAITTDEVATAFREAGKSAHPDAGGSDGDFEEIQKANLLLADPASRLRHWLELNGMEGDLRGSVTTELMTMFTELGELLQRVDGLIREREQAASALAKAMLEGRTQEVREELEGISSRLMAMEEARVDTFEAIERGERDGWDVARDLAFLSKWQGQVRERFAGLW